LLPGWPRSGVLSHVHLAMRMAPLDTARVIAQYCFRLPFRLVTANSSRVLSFQPEVVDGIQVAVKFAAEAEDGIAPATASAFEPPEHLDYFVNREAGIRLPLGIAEIQQVTVDTDENEWYLEIAIQALNNLITRLRVAGRAPFVHPITRRGMSWRVTYLNDDRQPLPSSPHLGVLHGRVPSLVTINPDFWEEIAALPPVRSRDGVS
jgi:hypothetical protein